MRRALFSIALTLALAGCVTLNGDTSNGFVNDDIARAFIRIDGARLLIEPVTASAFVVAPGIAVTNAHVVPYLGTRSVIGVSRDYDLAFFRVDARVAPSWGSPSVGEEVVTYGYQRDSVLKASMRSAHGVIGQLAAPVVALCGACPVQQAITFESNGGRGFSGGPVVDAASGRVVGVTFGYDDATGHRLMYAYPIDLVRSELTRILGHAPSGGN